MHDAAPTHLSIRNAPHTGQNWLVACTGTARALTRLAGTLQAIGCTCALTTASANAPVLTPSAVLHLVRGGLFQRGRGFARALAQR